MGKFEQSSPAHEVHEIHQPQGHGLMDQKHHKGMRSPIVSQVPQVDAGTVNSTPAGAPGQPDAMYGGGPQGN